MFLSSSTPYLNFKFCVILSHQQAIMVSKRRCWRWFLSSHSHSRRCRKACSQWSTIWACWSHRWIEWPTKQSNIEDEGLSLTTHCCQWHSKWYLIPQWRWKQGLTIFVTFQRNLPPFEIVIIQVQCAVATQQRLIEAFVSGSYFGRCLESSLGVGLPWWLPLSAWWQEWKRLLTKLSAICLLHTQIVALSWFWYRSNSITALLTQSDSISMSTDIDNISVY